MHLIAALIYWVIVAIWLAVLGAVGWFYLNNPKIFGTTRVLLAVIAIDTLRNIVENAGEDAAVILNQVKAGKGAYGYNAASGEFGDMLEEGILDPTKVTRLALQNAASIAGLLLTTEVMVADAPKDEEAAQGGMPGGGGMDM